MPYPIPCKYCINFLCKLSLFQKTELLLRDQIFTFFFFVFIFIIPMIPLLHAQKDTYRCCRREGKRVISG
jgi:hypothetical protein